MGLATSHWLTWCWPRLMTPNKTIACFTKSNAFFIVKRNYFDGFGVMGNLEVPFIGTCYTKNHCQLKRPKMLFAVPFEGLTQTAQVTNRFMCILPVSVINFRTYQALSAIRSRYNTINSDTIHSLVIWKVNQTSHISTINNWKHMGV